MIGGVNLTVKRLLAVLPRNKRISIFTEYKQELIFEGFVWALDSKYILSLLVVDVWPTPFDVYITVVEQ